MEELQLAGLRVSEQKLPPDAQENLKVVARTVNSVGPAVVEHARNHTFHYPDPSPRYESDAELIRVLEAQADEPISFGRFDDPRRGCATPLRTTSRSWDPMGKHDSDSEEYKRQVVELEEGAAALVELRQRRDQAPPRDMSPAHSP